MSRRQTHFLLIYDVSRGQLRGRVRKFDSPEIAVANYQAAEARFSADDNVQVVLVASDSIETVKRTHSNFWKGESIKDLLHAAIASAG